MGNALSSGDLVMTTDNASKENAYSDSDKLTGEFGDEKRFLSEDNINTLLGGINANSENTKKSINETLTKRYSATVNYNNSLGAGVGTNSGVTTTINTSELGRKDNEMAEEGTARLAKLKTLSDGQYHGEDDRQRRHLHRRAQ